MSAEGIAMCARREKRGWGVVEWDGDGCQKLRFVYTRRDCFGEAGILVQWGSLAQGCRTSVASVTAHVTEELTSGPSQAKFDVSS